MPAHRKIQQPEYTLLGILINDYHVRSDAGTNLHLHGSPRTWIDENEPVYTFETHMTLYGTCMYPEDRAGDSYEITLFGSQSSPRDLRLKVKDLHERDKKDMPRYHTYRGVCRPVYAEPPSLTFVNKIYGESRWTVWLPTVPQMVTDSLLLVSGKKPVYVSMNEKKVGRQRHVQSLSVQTTDPSDE